METTYCSDPIAHQIKFVSAERLRNQQHRNRMAIPRSASGTMRNSHSRRIELLNGIHLVVFDDRRYVNAITRSNGLTISTGNHDYLVSHVERENRENRLKCIPSHFIRRVRALDTLMLNGTQYLRELQQLNIANRTTRPRYKKDINSSLINSHTNFEQPTCSIKQMSATDVKNPSVQQ